MGSVSSAMHVVCNVFVTAAHLYKLSVAGLNQHCKMSLEQQVPPYYIYIKKICTYIKSIRPLR
jgi:hypothetical protein